MAVLDERLGHLAPSSRWERWEIRSLADDLAALRRRAVSLAVEEADRSGGTPAEAVAGWVDAQRELLTRAYRQAGSEAVAGFKAVMRALMDEGARAYVDGTGSAEDV